MYEPQEPTRPLDRPAQSPQRFESSEPAEVVVHEKTPALNEPSKKAPKKSGPKWEAEARERLRTAIRKLQSL